MAGVEVGGGSPPMRGGKGFIWSPLIHPKKPPVAISLAIKADIDMIDVYLYSI